MLAGARRVIQRVGRHVVAEPIAAIAREPQIARARIPVETDAVANAPRERLEARPVGVHSHDVRVPVGIGLADVARRADGHVELAVGSERDELASMLAVGRKPVRHDDRLRRIVEPALDVVEAQDTTDGRHVERSIAERNACRLAQVRRDRADGPGSLSAGRGGDRIDVPADRAREQRAVGAECHLPRAGHARDELDREPGRKPDLIERQRLRGERLRRRAGNQQCAEHPEVRHPSLCNEP